MTHLTKEQSIEFEREKTLYHYTSIHTAIENIFPSSRLRLSPLGFASDPMENQSPHYPISVYEHEEENERLRSSIDENKISKEIDNYHMSLRQLCLCKNAEVDFKGQYTGAFEPIDHFGFVKPRMWDQYGDKYKGICIALSRNKLEEQLSSKHKKIDIKYIKNYLFKSKISTSSVDLTEVKRLGKEKYLESKYESILKEVSEKYIDYKDENEFKVVIPSEDDYEYIDIENCIQAIFVTNKLNYTYRKWLKKIASDYKVPLIQILIKRTGIKINEI
jgi:hypothetical protein